MESVIKGEFMGSKSQDSRPPILKIVLTKCRITSEMLKGCHSTVANVTYVRTISGLGKRQFIGIVYGHIIYI